MAVALQSRHGTSHCEPAKDGRIVREVLLAGYRSARMGVKIGLPFRPTGIKRPIDLWLGAADEDLA